MITMAANGIGSEHRLVNDNEVSFFCVHKNKNNGKNNGSTARVVLYLSF